MSNEITLSGARANKNNAGEIIEELGLSFLIAIPAKVDDVIPTPSINSEGVSTLNRIESDPIDGFTAGEKAALDDGSAILVRKWMRYSPKLTRAYIEGEKATDEERAQKVVVIDPPPEYPTTPELAVKARALYARTETEELAAYDDKYRDLTPVNLPVPLGTRIDKA